MRFQVNDVFNEWIITEIVYTNEFREVYKGNPFYLFVNA